MNEIFIEAESFSSLGGWTVDQQSMEVIGSSYIMAHGLGKPVEDASTCFTVNDDGTYNVYALTRDWTSVWDVSDSAGKFTAKIDGAELPTVLGTNGKEWAWQLAGSVSLKKGKHTFALHDLTGFNGRCDAVYITQGNAPNNDKNEIEKLRERLNYREIENVDKKFDLIIVGGGIAGTCTALTAYWKGLDVLLINDRSVLGGCNSSEIRVNLGGRTCLPPYEKLGEVLNAISPIMGYPNLYNANYYEDFRKIAAFEAKDDTAYAEEYGKYKLALNESVTDIEMQDKSITAVITTNTLTGKKKKYFGKLFVDCSGDGIVARKAGAETMYGREARDVFNETLAPLSEQKLVMGHSIRWFTEDAGKEESFPDINWNLPFNDDNCLNVFNGDWEQECGFRRDMVRETEYIRDFGLRAILSNWSYQKNHYKDKEKFKNYKIVWASAIGGKREGYRVKGDYIVTQNDIENHVVLPDSTACATWSIDMHFPLATNEQEFGEAFRSFAYHRGIVKEYQVPYRSLYSKDVDNLFIGGRLVSASHVGFSVLRVMRTLGTLGEVVGYASRVCINNDCNPRAVYTDYLDELISLMKEGVHVPSSFECTVGEEEAYHFKDFGWYFIDEKHKYRNKKPLTEKEVKNIKSLQVVHKYQVPEELK